MSPKISVIFPVGNREAFLAEALESILAQSFTDWELIVVLDGVAEPVQAIAEGYRDERIRIVHLPVNLGVSNARNAAMLTAQAPYLALMDSDDVALPQRLAIQYEWMQAHTDVTVCGSNSVKLLEDGRRVSMRYPETDGQIKARLLLVDSAILNPTALLRSDFVHHHALRYDANLPRDHDHRFYVEMTRLGATFYGLQQELLLYRRHAGNATQDQQGVDAEKTRVREVLTPLYFPELTGNESAMLLKGLCQQVQMTVEEACFFVTVVNKAAEEARVFRGEDRAELRRILQRYKDRVLQSLVGAEQTRP
jgi:glycosyltransferase involved in cell wall biosynthesis